METTIKLLKIIARQFSEEEINDILTKKARLKIERPAPKTKSAAKAAPLDPPPDMTALRARLKGCASTEEAKDYIKNLQLSREQLLYIAGQLDLPLSKRPRQDAVLNRIVDHTVSARLRSEGLRNV